MDELNNKQGEEVIAEKSKFSGVFSLASLILFIAIAVVTLCFMNSTIMKNADGYQRTKLTILLIVSVCMIPLLLYSAVKYYKMPRAVIVRNNDKLFVYKSKTPIIINIVDITEVEQKNSLSRFGKHTYGILTIIAGKQKIDVNNINDIDGVKTKLLLLSKEKD